MAWSQAAVRSVPIPVGPFRQPGFALLGGGAGAGLFAQGGLDEPPGPLPGRRSPAITERGAVGFRRAGLGSDVVQLLTVCGEGLRLIARPVVRCPASDYEAICRGAVITRVTVMPRLL